MKENLIQETAQHIYDAQVNKQEIIKLTADRLPDLTIEEGYRIQQALVKLFEADGRKVLAPKMGLTSKAKMQQMNVDAPIVGYVFEDMIETSGTISMSDYIHPKVEPEIGIVLKKDLQGPGVTMEDVLENIDYVFSCIEIIDSRYKNFDFDLPSVVADNTSASGAVFSEGKHSAKDIDLANEKVTLSINGEVKAEGDGTDVLGHPAESIAYLANILGKEGKAVKAGEPIMTGGMTAAFIVKPGDTVDITYSNLDDIHIRVIE